MSSSSHTEKLLCDLHFLPAHSRIIYKICLLCYKCFSQEAPSYLTELIQLREQSTYNLRIDNDLTCLHIPPKPHLKKSEYAFKHYAPSVWNALPASLRSISSVATFKASLKTFLFEKAYQHLLN